MMVKIKNEAALKDVRKKVSVSVSAGAKPKKIGTAWAVIRDPANGKYLLCQRSATSNNPHQWGFAGGGVDEGETAEQGLLRELFEEIKVKLTKRQLNAAIADHKEVLTTWFEIFQKVSPKKTEEVSAFVWVHPHEFDEYHLHKSVRHYFKTLASYAKEVHKATKGE